MTQRANPRAPRAPKNHRRAFPRTRRQRRFLTDKGRAFKAKLVPLAEEVNRIAASGLSAIVLAAARSVLLAIITHLANAIPVKAGCV